MLFRRTLLPFLVSFVAIAALAQSGSAHLVQDPTNPNRAFLQIAVGDFTVAPRNYRYFQITVPDSTNVETGLSGKFHAEGGDGNDIQAFVTDQDGFTNFQNGHGCRTYYNSGTVTVGAINIAHLDPGVYYLVYNNGYSLITNKVVHSKVWEVFVKH